LTNVVSHIIGANVMLAASQFLLGSLLLANHPVLLYAYAINITEKKYCVFYPQITINFEIMCVFTI
jgi:hypothetical protein